MTNEEAIKVLKGMKHALKKRDFRSEHEALDIAIETLSAEPKTGEWVEIENGEYLCSNCSHIIIGYPPNVCPNCRARMQGR